MYKQQAMNVKVGLWSAYGECFSSHK